MRLAAEFLAESPKRCASRPGDSRLEASGRGRDASFRDENSEGSRPGGVAVLSARRLPSPMGYGSCDVARDPLKMT